MISNKSHKERVSSFREIDMSKIEFVSFFYKNGKSKNVVREQVGGKKIQAICNLPFLFAFINITEGGFIIVY